MPLHKTEEYEWEVIALGTGKSVLPIILLEWIVYPTHDKLQCVKFTKARSAGRIFKLGLISRKNWCGETPAEVFRG